jgi:hypothetical protein
MDIQQVMMKDRIIEQQQMLLRDRILRMHAKEATAAEAAAPAAPVTVTPAVGCDLRNWQRGEARYKGQKGWHACTIRNGVPAKTGESAASTYDVYYDDGDKEEAIARYRIRRIGEGPRLGADGNRVYAVDDLVDARYQGGKTYYAARVKKFFGGKVNLQFLDGDTEEGVSVEDIEGLYGEIGSSMDSSSTTGAFFFAPAPLKEGDAVEGRYKAKSGQMVFYKGAVLAVNNDGTFKIRYADGDLDDKVARRKLRRNDSEKEPLDLEVGQDVDVYHAAGEKLYAGKISAVVMVRGHAACLAVPVPAPLSKHYDISFEDGDKEFHVPRALVFAANVPNGAYERSMNDVANARAEQKARLEKVNYYRQMLVDFYQDRYQGHGDEKDSKLQQVNAIMLEYQGREHEIEKIIEQTIAQDAAPPLAPA